MIEDTIAANLRGKYVATKFDMEIQQKKELDVQRIKDIEEMK